VQLVRALQSVQQLVLVGGSVPDALRSVPIDLACDELAERERHRAVSGGLAEVGPHVIADLDPRLVISRLRRRPAANPASASSSHAPQSTEVPKAPRVRIRVDAALRMQVCAGLGGLLFRRRLEACLGAGRARVLARPRRLRGMATARRFKRHEEQLELAPRIGLSEPLLRPEEAAELLSVKVSWIYEACRVGRLPHLRVGKHIRFMRSELEHWLVGRRF
jgi:excisionase family DNA binding protein